VDNEDSFLSEHPARVSLKVREGVVLVGSDGHYWPGRPSVAHRGFCAFAKELRPKAVIFNGDSFDGSRISRHPPIGWEKRPTVIEEIEACRERLGEIEKAAKGARLIHPLGNHDGRFETRLAQVAPEFARIHGFHLKDHFPAWEPCWDAWINNDVVVKHRYKGGRHAPSNNAVSSGKTMITGHLHSAKVEPITDLNGTRWGVDTGCLADPNAQAFVDYTENGPKDWRAGFCVLTFVGGKLLMPELVLVWDKKTVQFRGELIRV
jgi:hypothetical protein